MLHYNFHKSEKETSQLLILLHGFISDSRTYSQHLLALLQEVNVLTIDLPGHGQDESSMEETWDFPYLVKQLDEVLDQFKAYTLHLLGYSMGGRVALYYALHGHHVLKSLILESTSPGIDNEDDRLERQQIDAARGKVLDIAGLEIFVNDWEKLPLFYTQYDLDKEKRKAIREMRMSQDPHRLAKALRDYGTGHMPNLWKKVKDIQIPCFILAGELDEKFVKTAHAMADKMNDSPVHIFKEVGHTIHVEDETEFDTIVLGFLKEEQND
ncbi:2-succinyl-6-hydroxy-2,4-cyclohexadiene-1-carboxylate synthase [Staphylococcus pragensis]|uniref:Putative 2-succinyl-6-hydroxy-2,4-cyclohexadiene-1-carboxylate synthase n=1 Tax=Staphylococcus pragensis TaxID=1611836 RepID=A0A4Z1C833_9STAP|nr:2-succinyl-6-hydroxy-2,4-cyclohexadiene-1-carboxylate synthase [Staphylococcus pragensis]RTX90867.1 2-succinyl-6-hydroxy-2,4-cyclohexadiene-1-carboxylate synthase [Staphylococcus carnosus]TGN28441.1 2-succinyl-6-hydroxy-2,4-cyclohexadiene-1-carboxylate synthase [Staphylococcus pragensis]GGG87577.1 putative 2-succinyl-6-hydroxy-2,4-cyclohexadiene-1-carboxylate synthase [Staphylococcus pragensis]